MSMECSRSRDENECKGCETVAYVGALLSLGDEIEPVSAEVMAESVVRRTTAIVEHEIPVYFIDSIITCTERRHRVFETATMLTHLLVRR